MRVVQVQTLDGPSAVQVAEVPEPEAGPGLLESDVVSKETHDFSRP